MPDSSWNKAGFNARKIGDVFALDDVLLTSVAFAAATSSTATVTHGLGATVDFVLASATGGDALTITPNSTSVTFVRTSTGASTVHALIGNKA